MHINENLSKIDWHIFFELVEYGSFHKLILFTIDKLFFPI